MPLAIDAKDRIRSNLIAISLGERPPIITIGVFTPDQFAQINSARLLLSLHPLELNEILFIGRHLYASRWQDGYSIEDMVTQIESAIGTDATVTLERTMSCTQNPAGRDDGYGNVVFDRAVFEMTAKKPRAELFSVIPKGDQNKPRKK